MDEQATMVVILVELATVERLDRIITATTRQRTGGEREAGDLDSYTAVIDWVTDIVHDDSTPEHWAHADHEAYHRAATDGPLVLIEVEDAAARALDGALAAMQGTVTYMPTYGTAISWFLNVARLSGHPAPGEH